MRRKHRPQPRADDFLAHPWKQIRVFIRTADPSQAYLDLLGYLVQPLAAAYPATPLWFTRYGPVALGEDDADTDINAVPPGWWRAYPEIFEGVPEPRKSALCTFSLRLRWAARGREESYIIQRLNAAANIYWYSSILAFDARNSFAEPRVYSAAGSAAHKRERANLVCHSLAWYSRFILHNLWRVQGIWRFEQNPHNWTGQVNFRFPLHMMNNASAQMTGHLHPVAIAMNRNGHQFGAWESL